MKATEKTFVHQLSECMLNSRLFKQHLVYIRFNVILENSDNSTKCLSQW